MYDQRYRNLVSNLRQARKVRSITQKELASRLGQPQSYVAKVENLERRLDIIELADWLVALGHDIQGFLAETGVLAHAYSTSIPALPLEGRAITTKTGIEVPLVWQGHELRLRLDGLTVEEYLDVERQITRIYRSLEEPGNSVKNREAIALALEIAIDRLPNVNPSDIYHHVVYRLYLREYRRTHADRSWVRAGGEALELFLERHYTPLLRVHGISIKALFSSSERSRALREMGIAGQVGSSKLDVALYGRIRKRDVIFGGIHVKASLAERVSDDVPCSQSMMSAGYCSFLVTFDAKSFPPPLGDLVNRGELGSPESPSDKRRYVEEQGLFDACFSYNLRTMPSRPTTMSGSRILVGSFTDHKDPLPAQIVAAWERFTRHHLSQH